MDEIYRSDTIVVRRVACTDQTCWAITFDNHSIGAGFDRPGFGEAFLQQEGISAIHVLGCGNDWYHYPDINRALAAVRRALRGATRRVAYGSSMGGFAALRLAWKIDANRVVALSPQYSVDLAVVPWERRWEQDSNRIVQRPELSGPIRLKRRPIVIYDPKSNDARHVALINADAPSKLVPIPYAGHPVSTFLAEIGLLREIVVDAIRGRMSGGRYKRTIRKRRRHSTVYLGNLAELQPAWRPRTALGLARMAAAAGGAIGSLSLARILARNGADEEAFEHYRKAIELSARDTNYLIPFAEALLVRGDVRGAIAIAHEVVAKMPEIAHLRHWYGWLLATNGDYEAAIVEERRALTLFPAHPLYETTLAAYLAKVDRGPRVGPLRTLRDRLRGLARPFGG